NGFCNPVTKSLQPLMVSERLRCPLLAKNLRLLAVAPACHQSVATVV
ncbi:uncharacterized protein METZ01_LOCUS152809, partial [marine metagenome]